MVDSFTPSVSAIGTSRVEVTADAATIVLEVERRVSGRDICEDALREFNEALSHTLTGFDSIVTGMHILTTTFSDEAEIGYWCGRNTIKIEVARFSRLGGLYDALLKLNAVRIHPPRWLLRHDHPVWASVRRDAVRDATNRCRTLAEAAGTTLSGLLSITDTSGHPDPVEVRLLNAGVEVFAFSTSPAQLVVEASAEVRYALPSGPTTASSLTGYQS